MDITSSKMASQDGLKPDPLRDLGDRITKPGASSGRGSASFTQLPPTLGVASVAATTKEGTSVVFPYADAPRADPSS
jgi:hypothetical protein